MPDQWFTLVIPTRNDPESCRLSLDALLIAKETVDFSVRVLFLANDSAVSYAFQLEAITAEEQYASLQPRVTRATRDYPTCEQNIFCTLEACLDSVDEQFFIIGNTDSIDLKALRDAALFLRQQQLDLLLVGVVNREVYQGQALRQLYATPRHFNAKNRLKAEACSGKDLFAAAATDYGLVDYLAYIGCQMYTRRFFKQLCGVAAKLPEQVYSIPLATLELTSRNESLVGFFPEVVAARIDHLQYGPNSPEMPVDHWFFRARTDRGLSRNLLLSVISNSLKLAPAAFETLVNSQSVAMVRAAAQYRYSNFLCDLVMQTTDFLRKRGEGPTFLYSASEQQDLMAFAERLQSTDVGLPEAKKAKVTSWLRGFGRLGNYADEGVVTELISDARQVHSVLNERTGMEKWVAKLSTWTLA